MGSIVQDVCYGARMLARQRGFTVLAVLTLAVGIGCSTAIFTILNSVVLRPLPYRNADRLAIFWVGFGEHGQSLPAVSPPDFRDFQLMSHSFDELAAANGGTANLTGKGDPEQVDLGRITHNLLPLLGFEPALGRGFLPDEDVPNGPDVTILSHTLWQRRFGGDPGIIGQTVLLSGVAQQVVGVMPAGFRLLLPPEAIFLRDPEVWTPLRERYQGIRNRTTLTVFGRLRDGVAFHQAQEEMDAIAAQLREAHAVHKLSDTWVRVAPLQQDVIRSVRPALFVLFGAVGMLLLIACGNVANLLLGRAISREREFAIRAALGAGRGRVARQILTESGLLALAGGALGLLIASWGIEVLLALRPAHLPRLEAIAVDGSTLVFTVAASFLTVLLFGMAPAMAASRPRFSAILRENGKVQSASGRKQLHRMVAVCQVALALLLLIGVGLLLRSFESLRDVRPGFNPQGILTFGLALPPASYPNPEDRYRFYHQLEDRLRSLPGVQSVGAISHLPLAGGGAQGPYAFDAETEQHWESATADARFVTAGFFTALQSRLLAGRPFDERDTAAGNLVVIVDELLAIKAWPGQDPIGRRLLLPVVGPEGVSRRWHEVIGVVEHLRVHDLSRDVREQVYLPHSQRSTGTLAVMVRTAAAPAVLSALVQREVRALDKDLPVYRMRQFAEQVEESMAQTRFTLIVAGLFGGISLLLALIGLYGVMSYMVSQRTHEFGLRMALGAQARGLFRLVMAEGLKLTIVGIVLGLAGALAAGRAIASLLYGVSATDPLTIIGTSILVAAVALLSCYLPARRATRVDPAVALRGEVVTRR